MRLRYADRLAGLPELPAIVGLAAEVVVYTGVAVTGERRPVGHGALRGPGGEASAVELKRMYVVPRYRPARWGSGPEAWARVPGRTLSRRRL